MLRLGMDTYEVEETRDIHLPESESQANILIRRHILRENVTVVGLDCEWETTGKQSVALIQVATVSHVILFQTCNFPSLLPERLHGLLEDPSVVKVGVNIEEDVRRIQQQYGTVVRGWLDLRQFSLSEWFLPKICHQFEDHEAQMIKTKSHNLNKTKELRRNFMPKLGLAALVYDFLDLELPKPAKTRAFGGWEEQKLSRRQVLYAASDAAAGLDVFFCFEQLEDRRQQINGSLQDLESEEDYSESSLFNWNEVIEKTYDQKIMRSLLLGRILDMPKYSHLSPEYYGKSYITRTITNPELSSSHREDDKVTPKHPTPISSATLTQKRPEPEINWPGTLTNVVVFVAAIYFVYHYTYYHKLVTDAFGKVEEEDFVKFLCGMITSLSEKLTNLFDFINDSVKPLF